MNPQPIPSSSEDLERRRLESTLEADLHSLSLSSLLTTTSANSPSSSQTIIHHNNNGGDGSDQISLSSISSIEHPRAFGEGLTGRSDFELDRLHNLHQQHYFGPSGTPRAAGRTERNVGRGTERISSSGAGRGTERIVSGTGRGTERIVSGVQSEKSVAQSPVSTAGHHVSQMTLGVGVFERDGGKDANGDLDDDDDWDPERSLGRLVGELGRVMGDKISQRPTSPFSPSRSPRSPSPLSSVLVNQPNLSLTLNRNDPLLSPPISGASDDTTRKPSSGFTSMAQRLGDDLRASKPQARRALSDTTAHNIAKTPGPKRASQKDKLKNLQGGERRTNSAPAGRPSVQADVTGMTNLLETPAKGMEHGVLGKNTDVGGKSGSNIPQTLATLHARLRALETENSLSRRRVRELEGEVERARKEVEDARNHGNSQLREVIEEKTALEDLVASLRVNLARITSELEHSKALVAELRAAQSHPSPPNSPPPPSRIVTSELQELRKQVERLGNEVQRLGGIVEEGLETRRRARGERTIRLEAEEAAQFSREIASDEDLDRVRRDVQRRSERQVSPQPAPSRLRQGLHAAAAEIPVVVPPTEQPNRVATRQNLTPPASDNGSSSPTPISRSSSSRQQTKTKTTRRVSYRAEGPASPFPSIRAEDEESFFSVTGADQTRREAESDSRAKKMASVPVNQRSTPLADGAQEDLPPQTVLARVIGELEADFAHYKSIYSELADQYKVLDAASNVGKRRVLADHLREVIDTLEQKADQIASLYDLLHFKDRPLTSFELERQTGKVETRKSVHDVLRMVRETLGDEGMRRLERDGGRLWRQQTTV
ncbi:hypothetical protein BCR39DRAFT_523842 [Naematelia encephala]|uniref:Cep57 centrosome microtubule-binding domain-containing protein n=1 Tax=Naematelia encephala TaxID=71784 RepID=A0A1Y2BE08_9TREE|nr:hypothetical protein BCR39DRAFT_523842 [Naematelia encephala]